MRKVLCLLFLCCAVFSTSFVNTTYAAEQEGQKQTITENQKKPFKWGKYYEIPDLPYEIAINSFKKGVIDVKLKDPIEGTVRFKLIPARQFVYIYEKDINQFGGWRCVQKTRYEDDSFIAEIAATSISILKEAGVLGEDLSKDE